MPLNSRCQPRAGARIALVVALLAGMSAARADEAPRVTELAWMTGSWAGPAGPDRTLEENWITPSGGSIASLVRITTADATPLVELVVIEELLGTLVLHVQQWDPEFKPRPAGPQTLTLAELGERRVRFQGEGDGNMRSLTYSSPDPQSLVLEIEMSDGQKTTLPLEAR
jgi:hypothetical protein